MGSLIRRIVPVVVLWLGAAASGRAQQSDADPNNGGGQSSVVKRTAARIGQILPASSPAAENSAADAGDAALTPQAQTVTRGTSSPAAKHEALAALPLKKLSAPDQQRAKLVLDSLSLFRRLPTLQFQTNPKSYLYFAQHPDVAVSVWRVLGISEFQMRQAGDNAYDVRSDDGSEGTLQVLHQTPEQCVVLCQGMYKSPLLVKPIQTQAVIHLQTQFLRDEGDNLYANHFADLFVSFPSQTVESAAKLISPVSNLMVDRNFREISVFLQMMSMAMSSQPGWIEQLVTRLNNVEESRRNEMLKVAAQVFIETRKQTLARETSSEQISLDDLMRPLRDAAARSNSTNQSGAASPTNSPAAGEEIPSRVAR